MRRSHLLALGLSAVAVASPITEAQPVDVEAADATLESRDTYFTYCQVVGSAVKYRTCPSTSCTAVGQYSSGKVVKTKKTSLSNIPTWIQLANGYYIYSYYCLPSG